MLSQANLSHEGQLLGITPIGTAQDVNDSQQNQGAYELSGPRVWHGQEYRSKEGKYVIHISQPEILELELAVSHFKSLNIARGFITPDTFPLPTFSQRLKEVSREVHEGRGFCLLRGLGTDKYSDEDNIILFAGVASHVGSRRCIEGNGLAMNHIHNVTRWFPKSKLGPSKRPGAMDYHSDLNPGEVGAFRTLHPGNGGGTPSLASSWTVYNVLRQTSPETLDTLREIWQFERDNKVFARPPLIEHKDKIMLLLAGFILGNDAAPRPSFLPPITDSQRLAYATVITVANAVGFPMVQQKGDIYFLHNLSILHARDHYNDDDSDEANLRHVLRIHVRDERFEWEKPDYLMKDWEHGYDHTPEQEILPILDWDPTNGGATGTFDHG